MKRLLGLGDAGNITSNVALGRMSWLSGSFMGGDFVFELLLFVSVTQ